MTSDFDLVIRSATVVTASGLDGLNMEGARYVYSPPLRDRDSQEACWEGIASGAVKTFSSDHCLFFYEGSNGRQNSKARISFRCVPNGTPASRRGSRSCSRRAPQPGASM